MAITENLIRKNWKHLFFTGCYCPLYIYSSGRFYFPNTKNLLKLPYNAYSLKIRVSHSPDEYNQCFSLQISYSKTHQILGNLSLVVCFIFDAEIRIFLVRFMREMHQISGWMKRSLPSTEKEGQYASIRINKHIAKRKAKSYSHTYHGKKTHHREREIRNSVQKLSTSCFNMSY